MTDPICICGHPLSAHALDKDLKRTGHCLANMSCDCARFEQPKPETKEP